MTIHIPKDVQNIIDVLESNGHSAYIVGGCVRDAIMGRTPHDYDICTSALPDEVLSIFNDRKVIETGLKHGTVTVEGSEDYYEVTTYRVDGEYTDGRHPNEVRFVDNVVEDLSRRDFTINAMAYNERTGLVDPFHGADDIQNGLIRCVGNPENRFNEDALRIMRAVRFASTCEFTIHEDTQNAMLAQSHLLEYVSEERKRTEFCKMLVNADADLLMTYKNIFATFIPELKQTFDFQQNNPHHSYDVYEHIAHSVAEAPKDLNVRLALMFHDIAKPLTYTEDSAGIGHFYGHAEQSAEMSKDIMKRMRFDNETIATVSELVASHDMATSTSLKSARKMISKFGDEQAERLIEVMRADKLAQSENIDTITNLRNIDVMESNLKEVRANNECFTLKNLAVNGHDLMAIGINDGKTIGRTLNQLLDVVIAEPEKNEKNMLLKLAMELQTETTTVDIPIQPVQNTTETLNYKYNDFIINDKVMEEYWGCSKYAEIPNDASRIGSYAFSGNETVEVVKIPASVVDVDPLAFHGCNNLKCIIAPEHLHESLKVNNPNIEIVNHEPIHNLSSLKETGHAIVSNDGELLLVATTGKLVIHESDNIRTINENAFQYGTITSVEGPQSLQQQIPRDIKFECSSEKDVGTEELDMKSESSFFVNE